jgi:membrane associated rhomboid family serine protease
LVIPVYDENGQVRGRPRMMWSIVAANVVVLGFFWLLSSDAAQALASHFGVVPGFVTGAVSTQDLHLIIPPVLTLLTYQFIHASWLHLASNMIFLWVFGDNVEAALGHLRFLLFYLLCGIAGGLVHVLSDRAALVPLVGASGAVAGVVGGYLLLRPWAHVTVLVLGFMTVRVHAYLLIGFWIAWQFANVLLSGPSQAAYWSHFGGLLAGAGLVVVLRRRGVKLFQRHVAHPRALGR